jgi:feruloyl esterase
MGAKHVHVGLLQRNGGWLSPGKLVTLQKGVLAACDELDGLKDGVISNIWACSKFFDATALRCEGGQNTGDTCLADPEIAVVKAIHGSYEYGFPLANGITSYPSWGYGGETQPGGLNAQIAGSKPPAFPPLAQVEQGQLWFYTNGVIRYFIAKDPNLDPSKFNPHDFVARTQELSATLDATNPDLSAFKQRGGKLIMRSNLADYSVSPFSTMNYYESVTKFMGEEAVQEFIRFYLSAGSSHGGPVFSGIDRTPVPSQTDLLTLLDAWVDNSQSPPRDKLIQTLHTNEAPFSVIATRPMCAYPAYPHYVGAGDPKSQNSYECRKP